MTEYLVEVPDRANEGIRIGCEEHDDWKEFQPGYRRVAFYCEDCGYEIDVSLRDPDDWRDWGEMC